ncbi:MAG: hypothetical protein JW956_11305 [Calditrichaceae bacterium]|nr:hypothetical protein [Calditrichaceae bacterium]
MKRLYHSLLTVFILIQILTAGDSADNQFLEKMDTGLRKVLEIQRKIEHIHTFLSELHPIAVYKDEKLFIYDYDSSLAQYQLVKKADSPFPMSPGIRASFPLSVYENIPACVVSPDVFEKDEEIVLIFHEFMHCVQYSTVEFRLKEQLKIYQQAMTNKDYMWEINHPFPYSDSIFVKYYDAFLSALNEKSKAKIIESKKQLKNHLTELDYEYMTWQEWKEGFARYIENRIKQELGLKENFYGKEKPYNRIIFYYGGELLIKYLYNQHKRSVSDINLLYNQIYHLEIL